MSSLIRLLHLEGSRRDAELIQERLLIEGFECDFHVVRTREQFEDALNQRSFDLILCDFNVPGYDGGAALRLAQSVLPAVPVIMISGGLSEYEAVDCLHMGAADYVLKQSLVRLPTAIKRSLAQVRDQTLRVQAENRFRWLMESAPDAMVIVDSSGAIVLVNTQAENLFLYDRAELFGKPVEILLPTRFRSGHATLVQDFLRERRSRTVALPTELLGLRKDGIEIPVEILLSTLEQIGETLTIAGIRDLTERKKLELLLSRSQRMESIGTFAGKIAHDLNNAFAPVLMSLELLRIQSNGSTELVDTIEAGAKHGTEMLRQLLIFSKGSFVEPEQLNPTSIVNDAVKYVQLTFPTEIELEISIASDLKPIWGDKTQLHQVLTNLCGNARDAMPNGGKITICAEMVDVDESYASFVPDATPGKYVMFRVSDTGTGMPRSVLDRIFEPFYTTKPLGKGTGLGLSIVIGIIRSHAGFINVYSLPGNGSTFSVYVPADRICEPGAPTLTSQKPRLDGQGELILVVDDSREIRMAASAVLSSLNFRPIAAEDGVSAMRLAKEYRDELKVVISDLHMPNKDGKALVSELMLVMPSVGLILMSGNFIATQIQELKAQGVKTFLDKPFTQEMLTEALQSVIER